MANENDLGSARVGFEVDLKQLGQDLNKAARMIGSVQQQANQSANATPAGKGGIFGALLGNGREAGLGLSLLGNFQGSLGRVGSAVGGVSRLFGGMGAAGAAAGASMGAMIPIVGLIVVALAGLVIAAKAASIAFDQIKQSIAAAGDQQAIETSFGVLSDNLDLAEGKVAGFRAELAKMSFTSDQQTTIMNGLVRSLGANGLSSEALAAATAMRDLSVAAGTDTLTGITELNRAITTLNPQLLDQYGITQTATQIFDAYGATIDKTADSMSITEKQAAILNAVVGAGAASAGLADRASGDLNRSLTRLQSNFKSLQAGVGQVFEPLASGIISGINQEILSMGGFVDANRGKFESLGQALAAKVIPMFQQLIAWIKSLPWAGIIDGAYRVAQGLQLVGRIVVGFFRSLGNSIQFSIGGWKVLGGAIGLIIGIFRTGAAVIDNFWKVLSGQASIGEGIENIKQAASDSMSGAFDTLIEGAGDMAGAVGDQFDNLMDFVEGAGHDIEQIIKGFDVEEWWASLPNGLQAPLAESLDMFKNTAGGMSKEALKALQKMQEQLAKENADFARNQANALRDYTESLADLVASHRDRLNSMKKDLNKETQAFEKAQAERTASYQDEINRLNKADGDRKKDVETQIAEELAKGRFADQARLASLRARLTYEDAAHQEAVEAAKERYDEDTSNASTAHSERIAEIQANLDEELAIQAKHAAEFAAFQDHVIQDDITKLKEQYSRRKAEDERAHQERLADIIRQGTEQAGQAGAQGQNIGNAGMAGYAGGIAAGKPKALAEANKAGKEAGDKTGEGMESKRASIGDIFGNVVKWAATSVGGLIGGIFGPVGAKIGSTIGEKLVEAGPAIGNALKNMLNSAINHIGNLVNWGKDVVGKIGQGISSAWGSAKDGFVSGWKAAGLPGFATGGIVGGRAGRDNVMAAVTAGEMILNKGQQQRLFSMLDGSGPVAGGGGAGNIIIENLQVSLPAVRNATDFERELQLKFSTMRVN